MINMNLTCRGKALKDEGWKEGWIYGYLYVDESGTYIKPSAKNMRFGCGCPVDPATVGVFTNLKDIANTDCYTGDIIKATWSRDINDKIFGIGKVIFNCGCFKIEWVGYDESNMELLGFIYKTGRPRVFKILGNVVDHNPEQFKTAT